VRLYDALSAIDVPPEKIRVVVQSMERDMALYATQSQFASLDQHSGSRFDLLRAEIAAFRERFEQIDKRFEQVDRRFEHVDKRLDHLDQQMETRFRQVDRRFDDFSRKLDESLHAVEQRLMVRLGSFLAVAVGVTAGLLKLLGG
jgi:tetrahydromethanopterin S-methyltransferase subunit G